MKDAENEGRITKKVCLAQIYMQLYAVVFVIFQPKLSVHN